jgi:large subunit ribosomal protein L21
MYAIVQAGGRQHKVSPGGFAEIDGTASEPGTELTLGQVLLVERDGGEILAGAPYVADARVLAVVEGETRGPKIRVFKKKRRKGMRRTKGHRAFFTRVRITDILLGTSERAEQTGSSESSAASPEPPVRDSDSPAPSPQPPV